MLEGIFLQKVYLSRSRPVPEPLKKLKKIKEEEQCSGRYGASNRFYEAAN